MRAGFARAKGREGAQGQDMPLRRYAVIAFVILACVWVGVAMRGDAVVDIEARLAEQPVAICTALGEDGVAQAVRLDWEYKGQARAAYFQPHGFHWANTFTPYEYWNVTAAYFDRRHWVGEQPFILQGRSGQDAGRPVTFTILIESTCLDYIEDVASQPLVWTFSRWMSPDNV